MHKKSIEGRTYYYTSYRDAEGKVRTKYLGTSAVEAHEKEKAFQKSIKKERSWKPYVLAVFLLLAFSSVFFISNFTGFSVLEGVSTVTFSIDPSWNLSLGYATIVQESYEAIEANLSTFVQGDSLVFDLTAYDLVDGNVTVSIFINDSLVANQTVYYSLFVEDSIDIIFDEGNETEEVIVEVSEGNETEPIIESHANPEGWFSTNSSGILQLDYAALGSSPVFHGSSVTCTNGSTSNDVESLSYLWYINDSLVPKNYVQQTLATTEFNRGDKLSCAILPVAASTKAYWPMDQGSGANAVEIVQGMNATLGGATWTDGQLYKALDFTATTNFEVANPTETNLSKNFTYSFWMHKRASDDGMIYAVRNSSTANVFTIGVSSNKVNVSYPIAANTVYTTRLLSASDIPLNRWVHVAVVYNNQTTAVYIDGHLDNFTASAGGMVPYYGDIFIGKDPAGGDTNFEGYIDEFAIFNHTFTTQDVVSQFSRGIAKSSKKFSLAIDTNQADFSAGNCTQTNCTIQPGNVTLAILTGANYYPKGNISSVLRSLPDGHDDGILYWNNQTSLGQNISLKVRTGIIAPGLNSSVYWGDWSGPDPTHSKERHLVMAFDFHEGEGNISRDVVNQSRVVQLNGNSFNPYGKHGMGFYSPYLRNAGASVESSAENSLSSPKNFTIEAWVYPLLINNYVIVSKGSEYFLETTETGTLLFNGSFGGTYYSLESTRTLDNDAWNHVAVTYNSDNRLFLYVNGVLEVTTTTTGNLDTSSDDFLIAYAAGRGKFNGTIDSVAIYNRTLSPNDIYYHAQDLFTNSTGGEYTGELHEFIQYIAYFETNNTATTPVLKDVSFRTDNYSAYLYNNRPGLVTLVSPSNDTVQSAVYQSNWTSVSDDDGDTVYYEFILANETNKTTPLLPKLAINNYSTVDIAEDNYTIMVAHLDYTQIMPVEGWAGTTGQTYGVGKWKDGVKIDANSHLISSDIVMFRDDGGTFEFWVRPKWSPGDGGTNTFLGHSNGTVSLNRSGTTLYLELNSTSGVYLTADLSSWNAHEWHHVAFAWEENGNLTLFLDGAEVNKTASPTFTTPIPATTYLGTNASGAGGNIFNGTFDEIRVSNIARVSHLDLLSSNVTATPSDYPDGRYYWFARPVQYVNKTFDQEKLYSAWTAPLSVQMGTNQPGITLVNDVPGQLFSNSNTTLNLSTTEPMNCLYRNSSATFAAMAITGDRNHGQVVSFPHQGNYTFYFTCNDSNNNEINTTRSFYVFNRTSKLSAVSKQHLNFSSNNVTHLNFTGVSGSIIGVVNLTLQNNVTGRVSYLRTDGEEESNPELNDTNLEGKKIIYGTVLVDDHLVRNMTGNATVTIHYAVTSFTLVEEGSARLRYYNRSAGEWVVVETFEPIKAGDKNTTFNTTLFGTFAITGNLTSSASSEDTAAGSSGEGAASDDESDEVIETESCELDFYYPRITAGDLESAGVYDKETGIVDIVFITNANFEDAFLITGCLTGDEQDNVYKWFYIRSIGIRSQDLESLSIGYGIDRSWVDARAGEDLYLVDENGEYYPLVLYDEDVEFYYYDGAVDRLGTFAVVAGKSAFEQIDDGSEEEDEGRGAAFFGGQGVSVGVSAFLYLILGSMMMYYVARLGVAGVLSRKDLVPIQEEDVSYNTNSMDSLKHFVWKELHNEELPSLLDAQGVHKRTQERLIEGAQALGRGKLEQFVYGQLGQGVHHETVVENLLQVGWDEAHVRGIIEKFRAL